MRQMTALVVFTDLPRAPDLIRTARAAVDGAAGRLIGVYAAEPFNYTPALGSEFPATVFDEHLRRQTEIAAELENAFLSATDPGASPAEWRSDLEAMAPIADRVLRHARSCDVIVAPLAARGGEGGDAFASLVEELAIEAGRPVLALPEAPVRPTFGSRVLVAWDGSREAARAAFDALPLLVRAQEVRLVSVVEAFDSNTRADAPGADIAATLAHHGAHCVAERIEARAGGVGDAILQRAADVEADLIVMGAYGHSRLRELVFGGASRTVFAGARVPIFVSH